MPREVHVVPITLLALLAWCACRSPRAAEVNLAPRDVRPLHRIEVEDADEAEILAQQLKVEPVRVEAGAFYFVAGEALLARLAALGYTPQLSDRLQVERRVVRVQGPAGEEVVLRNGARLINREEGYLVVDGSLAQLLALRDLGFRLAPLGRGEPRPREVRILGQSVEDVQRVNALHVDIFAAVRTRSGVLVSGAAFDYQIDALRQAGFQVERVSTVPRK